MDKDALRAAFVAAGREAAEKLPSLLASIQSRLREVDPAQVVCTLSAYGLMQAVSADGPAGRSMLPRIEQHHVELLQAIALTIPEMAWGNRPALGSDIEGVIEDIRQLSEAFSTSRMVRMEEEASQEDRVRLGLQERLRLHTQMVRNWGYYHQVSQVSKELYGAIDAELHAALGFTATDLIEVGRALVSLYETRSSERMTRLARVFAAGSVRAIVNAYYEAFPNLIGDADSLLAAVPGMKATQLKGFILSHSDLWLTELASFDATTIADKTGIERARVAAALDRLARVPGELSETEIPKYFMDNPIWTAPAIRHGSRYMFPVPQAIFSHIHRLMRRLVEEAGVRRVYEERRAAYLEAKVFELLRNALPSGRFQPSVTWMVDSTQYETDLLVTLDRTVLIVEAKSAALTAEALRGAPDRARKHIRELITAPAQQSQRLAAILAQAADGDAACLEVAGQLGIDATSIDTVIRLSVTLDDFSMIAGAEGDLKEAGWVPEELSLPATINIADLQTTLDILARPAFILNYFAEREHVQKRSGLLADELDLLGLYLSTGFHLSEHADPNAGLVATGMSAVVDQYYASLDAGIAKEKPCLELDPRLRKLLDLLESRKPLGWTTISIDLLRLGGPVSQKQFFDGVDELRKEVPTTYAEPSHRCAMVALPPEHAGLAIVFYVYPSARADVRHEVAQQLVDETLTSSGRHRCTFVAKQVERWELPYTFVGVAIMPRAELSDEGQPSEGS